MKKNLQKYFCKAVLNFFSKVLAESKYSFFSLFLLISSFSISAQNITDNLIITGSENVTVINDAKIYLVEENNTKVIKAEPEKKLSLKKQAAKNKAVVKHQIKKKSKVEQNNTNIILYNHYCNEQQSSSEKFVRFHSERVLLVNFKEHIHQFLKDIRSSTLTYLLSKKSFFVIYLIYDKDDNFAFSVRGPPAYV